MIWPAVIAAGGALAGQSLGMLNAAARSKKQFKWQKELMDKSYEQNQNMAMFNHENQMNMWRATGPRGQMEELKKAGLNPAMIYGMGGAGGQTAAAAPGQGGGAPNVPMQESGAEFGAMGMQLASMLNLQKAQKENIEADTANKIADTKETMGETPAAIATIEQIKQQTSSAKTQQELTATQNRLATLDEKLKGETLDEMIDLAEFEVRNAEQTYKKLVRDNEIGEETKDDIMKSITAEAIGKVLQNELTRQQTKESGARTAKTYAEMKLIPEQIKEIQASISQGLANVYTNAKNAKTNEGRLDLDKLINDVTNSTGLTVDTITKVLQAILFAGILKGKGPVRNPIGYK